MNSYLLHGEDQEKSRNKLSELIQIAKSNNFNVSFVDNSSIKNDLKIFAKSRELFCDNDIIIFENFIVSNKNSLQLIKELFSIKNLKQYIFWESKKVNLAKVKALQIMLNIIEFKFHKSLFTFLNSFSPKNKKDSIKLLIKAIEENSSEQLLIMLARQIRLLYLVRNKNETISLPSWQLSQLTSQSRKFSPSLLLKIHAQLLALDRKNKQSKLPEGLGASLELLMATI